MTAPSPSPQPDGQVLAHFTLDDIYDVESTSVCLVVPVIPEPEVDETIDPEDLIPKEDSHDG